MEHRSGFNQYEGDLLKGADKELDLRYGLFKDVTDGDLRKAAESFGAGPDGGCSSILDALLSAETVAKLEENLLLYGVERHGPLGGFFDSVAAVLRGLMGKTIGSMVSEGGALDALESELERHSDSDPYNAMLDAVLCGDVKGFHFVLGEVNGPVATPPGYLPVCTSSSSNSISNFPIISTSIPEGPWVLDDDGQMLRMIFSLSKICANPSRCPIIISCESSQAPALIALGHTVEADVQLPPLPDALVRRCAQDVLGGHLREPDGEQEPSIQGLIDSALIGSNVMVSLAYMRLRSLDSGVLLRYPETGYGLPAFTAWRGERKMTASRGCEILQEFFDLPRTGGLQEALRAGEAVMYACELIESIRYLAHPEDEATEGRGFIPDRVLRELGLAFVDDTIPGCALVMGRAPEPQFVKTLVRECQNRGFLIIAADEAFRQLQDAGVKAGWDRMLYPVGDHTAIVHAINFALRAALSFGNVAPGDRDRLASYLEKRPKVMVFHMGPLDPVRAALAFAAVMHKAVIVADSPVPQVADLLDMSDDPSSMVQKGMEMRGVIVQSAGVDIPVAYGPAFEGEVIRKGDARLEVGGGRSLSFELLVTREESQVHDGKIVLIGKDLDDLPDGGTSPFGMVIEVFGKRMEPDFEAVFERRVHQFLNYAEGVWHTGQRNLDWLRISREAFEAGFRLRHIGEILVDRLKNEFGGLVSRVQVTIMTDEDAVKRSMVEAESVYRQRDDRMAGLKDDSVDVFYTCTLCQSFAPDHVCIISPERLGLCGAINWLDSKASNRIASHGPNQPIDRGLCLDAEKGEWQGLNDTLSTLTAGKVQRVCMYSLMDAPMTSCGCFEAIVAMASDMQAVVVVDREYSGMTPLGMRFSTLAGSIGGGRQTPGFMGIGRKYLTSDKFLAAEGGLARVAWMPASLKKRLAADISSRAAAIGVPDLLDKIADETVCEDADGLMEWMQSVDHPALGMPPLL